MKYLFLILIVICCSCEQVVIVVDHIPSNTPKNANIYITGNFNYWDPGDPNFVLSEYESTSRVIKMPKGNGEISFKFTRGDWTSAEGNICGNLMEERTIKYGEQDTVYIQIQSWQDLDPENCKTVTFSVSNIPENTPNNDEIYITGNFNEWNPKDPSYKLNKLDSGYFITLEYDSLYPELEYKFTRGTWSETESSVNGIEVQKRVFEFGKADSIDIQIMGWADILTERPDMITFLVTRFPSNTPEYEPIYIVGNFNGWYPRDINYTLSVNKNGQPYISIPRLTGKMEYKFTRGGWEKVEGDINGERLSDRVLTDTSVDTVKVEILTWEDLY